MQPVPDRPYYSEYSVKWATLPWEKAQALALRRRVFCEEQSLFEGDDRDDTDDHAQLLVAIGVVAGWPEQVVGTVRIHQEAPGVWFGSRLAVDAAFRTEGNIGSTLIKLAVRSAHAIGCKRFLARVQSRNEVLFRRLHWNRIGEQQVRDRPHVIMEADLGHYPPFSTPYSGLVVRGRSRASLKELAPDFFRIHDSRQSDLPNDSLLLRSA